VVVVGGGGGGGVVVVVGVVTGAAVVVGVLVAVVLAGWAGFLAWCFLGFGVACVATGVVVVVDVVCVEEVEDEEPHPAAASASTAATAGNRRRLIGSPDECLNARRRLSRTSVDLLEGPPGGFEPSHPRSYMTACNCAPSIRLGSLLEVQDPSCRLPKLPSSPIHDNQPRSRLRSAIPSPTSALA
jgi:hypothetical protein